MQNTTSEMGWQRKGITNGKGEGSIWKAGTQPVKGGGAETFLVIQHYGVVHRVKRCGLN